MKKLLIILGLLLSLLTITSCEYGFEQGNTEEVKFTLPDISNKTYVEAIVLMGGKIQINPVYVESNEVLPGIVIRYGGNLKAGDEVTEGMTIDVKIAKKPSNAVSHSDKVAFVSEVSRLTGPDSEQNKDTLLNAGLYGTDLGFPVELADGTMAYLFGDSFSSSGMKGTWFSNFIALSKDNNFGDGLTFDSVITNENSGYALPFAQGKHQGGNETDSSVEVTKIPTGGITIGNTTYIFYMSIRFWGESGSWNVNYNQCIKSTDLKNWTDVTSLKWSENDAPNFAQIYPMKDPNSDYIYIYGIPGGRSGGCVVGRVTEANFENFSEYEYQTAKGTWKKGSTGLTSLKTNPYYIISPAVSEMTVCYNPYLGKYMTIFYRNGSLVLLTADKPDGIFGNPISLLNQSDYNGIYGGLTHANLLVDGGKAFYMTVSCWAKYNVYWVKVVLN